MEPSSFEELLAGARRGEGDALAGLWHRHARDVAAFVRARGAEDPDAVTSDVFLGAFGGLASFQGDETAFRALLFTIARRRVADDLRRRSRRVPVTSWDDRLDRRTVASVEEVVVAQQGAATLVEAIGRLSPGQRDVLLMRLVADLPIEAVAAALGKSPGTVKSLQRRGLDALRRTVVRDPGAEPGDAERTGSVSR
ncbi:RNA polymerase sigma factor [Nocardioides sp.]|uniref:RNA polymerase sigma factor n=1 Tax=Nocardioides sp. TaxID=35761 RepID=UPI0037849FF5